MRSPRFLRPTLLTVALLVPMAVPAGGQGNERPAIAITTVPPADAGGPDKMARIAGTVAGPSCDCQVVLFALGDVWYVQPWAAAPVTPIDRNRRWENDTHLGREYAALLVRRAYKPPTTTRTLPAVSGDVLAIARVPGKS